MRIHTPTLSATISYASVRAVALAGSLACCGLAMAAEALPDSLSGIRALPEVTIEAVTQKADRSTAPRFSLGSSTLKAMGATDISSALKRLPGINLKDYGLSLIHI